RAPSTARLGTVPRTTARASAIAQESQGNSFLVAALSLCAADAPSGAPLDELIRGRIAELPEAARRLLAVGAGAGRPIELAVALQAAGLDQEGEAVMATLRAVHFVRTRRGGDG